MQNISIEPEFGIRIKHIIPLEAEYQQPYET